MNTLTKAVASFKSSDYASALRLFERAGELYGRHVVDANILLCKKALREPKGSAAFVLAISSEKLPSPAVILPKGNNVAAVKVALIHGEASLKEADSSTISKDAISEQAALVRAALFDKKNSKRLNEALRYPTSPDAESVVDLLIASTSLDHAQGVRRIQDAFKLGRYAIVERWLSEALGEKPDDIELQLLAVRLDYVRGHYDSGIEKLQTLLPRSDNSNEALQLLAQGYAHQGQFLEAIATLTGGRGLTALLNSTPTLEQAKIAARLDWVSVALAAKSVNANFVDVIEKSCTVTGLPVRLVDVPYSLFFLGEDSKVPDAEVAGLFLDLCQRTGCTQIARVDPGSAMNEIECVGAWAFVFTEAVNVNAVLLDAIFAQKRSNEVVVKIMKWRKSNSGGGSSFYVAGVLASAEALRAFGNVSLADWLVVAERSLRVKTVLI